MTEPTYTRLDETSGRGLAFGLYFQQLLQQEATALFMLLHATELVHAGEEIHLQIDGIDCGFRGEIVFRVDDPGRCGESGEEYPIATEAQVVADQLLTGLINKEGRESSEEIMSDISLFMREIMMIRSIGGRVDTTGLGHVEIKRQDSDEWEQFS